MKHNLKKMTQSGSITATSRKVLLVVLVTLVLSAVAGAKDIALISNKGDSLPDITLVDLVKVCKGQTNRWPDGKPVTLIMHDPGSADMKIVADKIYGSTAEAIKELVDNANHSRKNRPAIIITSTDQEVIRKVEAMPGAVGLVDVYSITGAVDVVKIDGKLPLQTGYLLHGN